MVDEKILEGVSPALEDALFQRLFRRLEAAGNVALSGAGAMGGAVMGAAGDAAAGVRDAAGVVGNAALAGAKEAAAFVQKNPGVLAAGVLVVDPPVVLMVISALIAKKIIENRRAGKEPVAQLLFRVPESLRDDVKRLGVDEKRQMDELLIEAVVDLLIKYGRSTRILQDSEANDG